jgi:hypothetical protein
MKDAVNKLVWFYDQRAGAENLIKEANNDAGLAAYSSGRWLMNCNHFQLVMLAYNLNCWFDAVQPRGKGSSSDAEAHHVGNCPAALSVFWRPRSGGTPAESVSATAIITLSKDCFAG